MSELLDLNCTCTGVASTDDALLDAADRERQVDGQARALLHAHVPLLGALEALQLGNHGVGARIDEVEDVLAFAFGHVRHRDTGRVIAQRHGGAGQGAAAAVVDRTLHARAIILRGGRRGQQHEGRNDP